MGKIKRTSFTLLILVILGIGCQPSQPAQVLVPVLISADGNTLAFDIPRGITVQLALESAGIAIGDLDHITPPLYSLITETTQITIIRVEEVFEIIQEQIPYDRQELLNETMPSGDSRIVQVGQNGSKEITIRKVIEDGTEASVTVVSETILFPSVPEILMIGVQNPFTAITITGKLAYITSGNAWIMEGSTANRRPIVTTGDLDGRIFSLSPDGLWLLFSRKSGRPADQEINTLWIVSTTGKNNSLINLHISNVIHFADWRPGEKYIISYSTVEPRSNAPGWQANNDLYFLPMDDDNGHIGSPTILLESSSGGIYGWWGTSYLWSSDGERLAYSRPDAVGLVDIDNKALDTLVEITPLNTFADWAWIPGITWGMDGNHLYYITHAPPTGLSSSEESPYFDLNVISLSTGFMNTLIPQVGMFSYPSSSSEFRMGDGGTLSIAFLQAIFPQQSSTSHYRLSIMDRDGSEIRSIFPLETQPGIKPQINWGSWSPDQSNPLIAVLYEGNLWIVDTSSGQTHQVTSDGLTKQVDWK
jgi:hypothetical protein